jgi:hypothetical protein
MNAELDAKDRRLFDRYSKRLDRLQDSMSSPMS